MSHGIIKPIDKVLSTKGAEWHGLADVVPVIGDLEMAPLLFAIREGTISVDVDGKIVKMGNHKALVADFSACRPDLVGTEHELTPLHIPRASYQTITNGQMWDAAKTALKDVDGAVVSCVGTLEAGKKMFISVDLKGETEFAVNGDNFLAHLNLITSHDGTLAAQAYDSTVRIVCMNTLRWSLDSAGDVGFRVFHTAGATVAMSAMGDLVNSILQGRVEFRNQMEYLASVSVAGYHEAHEIALGYFVKMQGTKETATRTLNAAEGIATLFSRGAGNKGVNLYDLLNGATEYWTSGDGTGKKADNATKLYKANFGTAADHKSAFANMLMNADTVRDMREAGREAMSLRAQAGK